MGLLRYKRSLRRVKLDEIAEIAGNDWARVWEKLGITPRKSGRSLIGELRIGGKPAQPIISQLGYSDTADVVEELGKALGLSTDFSLEFLRCKRDRKSVIEIVEEGLLSYNDDSDVGT